MNLSCLLGRITTKIKILIMFQKIAIVCLIGLVCYSSLGLVDAKNLVLNSGFETGISSPENWVIGGPVPSMMPSILIEQAIGRTGSALSMISSNPNCHGFISQVIPVSDDSTYVFNAWYRTENVPFTEKSVLVRIKWWDEDSLVGFDYLNETTIVNNEWHHLTNRIEAVSKATHVEIMLIFRWSTGKVWWDDISMNYAEKQPPRNIRVSTVYYRPDGPGVAENISVIDSLLEEAGKADSDIVLLPEGWPTIGTKHFMDRIGVNQISGEASEMMAEKASKYNMYIVSGLYIWEGDTLSNAAILYERCGKIGGIYKKVQLPDGETEEGAVPGNEIPVFQTDFGIIGILVCWDLFFPEVSRILALKGAEILFCPIWGDNRGTDIWSITARSRAVDNGVYLVTSVYDNKSQIINPAGDILSEGNIQSSVLTETIDLNYTPNWTWLGNQGRATWKDLWRKDRRADLFIKLID